MKWNRIKSVWFKKKKKEKEECLKNDAILDRVEGIWSNRICKKIEFLIEQNTSSKILNFVLIVLSRDSFYEKLS